MASNIVGQAYVSNFAILNLPLPPISSMFMNHIKFPVTGNSQPFFDCECTLKIQLLFYHKISFILPAIL